MEELAMLLLSLKMVKYAVATVVVLLCILAYWMIFKKAGEAGWKALIPVYSTYIEYKLTWSGKMFGLLAVFAVIAVAFQHIGGLGIIVFLAASVGMVVMRVIACIKLSVSFGHGAWFGVGLVFLNFIFLLVLAFDGSEYIGPEGRRTVI